MPWLSAALADTASQVCTGTSRHSDDGLGHVVKDSLLSLDGVWSKAQILDLISNL